MVHCLRRVHPTNRWVAGLRILRLTCQEEKRLLERLENIESLNDRGKLQQRMHEQLGIRRGLEKHPEIAYRLLDAHDLFRDV